MNEFEANHVSDLEQPAEPAPDRGPLLQALYKAHAPLYKAHAEARMILNDHANRLSDLEQPAEPAPDRGPLLQALSKAHAEFQPVKKAATAGAGSYSYNYAELADILVAVKPALSKHGLVLFFDTGAIQPVAPDNPKAPCRVTVGCTLFHPSGASLRSELTLLAATCESKHIGGAITYGSRYLVTAMLAIPLHGEDRDIDGLGEKPHGAPQGPPAKRGRKPAPRKAAAKSAPQAPPELPPADEPADDGSDGLLHPEVAQFQENLWDLCLQVAGGDAGEAEAILQKATAFGDFPGYTDVGRIGEKVPHKATKKELDAFEYQRTQIKKRLASMPEYREWRKEQTVG